MFNFKGSISFEESIIFSSICIFKTSQTTRLPAPPLSPSVIIWLTLHSKLMGASLTLGGAIHSDTTSLNPAKKNSNDSTKTKKTITLGFSEEKI